MDNRDKIDMLLSSVSLIDVAIAGVDVCTLLTSVLTRSHWKRTSSIPDTACLADVQGLCVVRGAFFELLSILPNPPNTLPILSQMIVLPRDPTQSS